MGTIEVRCVDLWKCVNWMCTLINLTSNNVHSSSCFQAELRVARSVDDAPAAIFATQSSPTQQYLQLQPHTDSIICCAAGRCYPWIWSWVAWLHGSREQTVGIFRPSSLCSGQRNHERFWSANRDFRAHAHLSCSRIWFAVFNCFHRTGVAPVLSLVCWGVSLFPILVFRAE